ncbi:stress response protein NST1-like isoform X2 [Actinidia eriantha]|uniref:stress response protein NST1-like isoform X2 n=1 Tax=Actinidia eriantha TaxID=165200 RepID=UPI002589FD5A|nr:stress response protein NST1-like isoform X2 [Actinidia eriantha]
MAGARCTPTSFLPPSATSSPSPQTPILSLSSISTPKPKKPTRRKNHLRQKLLKTLTKPLIPELPPTSPIIPIESPHVQQPSSSSDQVASEEANESEVTRDLQVSEPLESSGVVSGDFGNFSTRAGIQLGLFYVGAFLFQTICAVWVFGSVGSGKKDRNLDSGGETRVLELGVDGNNEAKLGLLLNGSGVSISGKLGSEQRELEDKISEIRAMARDARKREKSDSKLNGLDEDEDEDEDEDIYEDEDGDEDEDEDEDGDDSDDDDVVDVEVKSGIEKEVERKLVLLRNKLEKRSEKSRVLPVSLLRMLGEIGDGVDRESLDMKDVKKLLMFKKKYKFRNPSASLGDKPKGFQGSRDHGINRSRSNSSVVEDKSIGNGSVGNDSVDLLDKEQKLGQSNGNSRGSVSLPLEEDNGRKPSNGKSKSFQTPRKELRNERVTAKSGKRNGVAKPDFGIGVPQRTALRKPLVKSGRSRKSSTLDAHNSQSQIKEIQETTTISNEPDTLRRNTVSKSREVGIKQAAGNSHAPSS